MTEASTYTLSAELYANQIFITQVSTRVGLESGTRTVTLRFDGDVIHQKQLDGPYTLRNVLLLDESQILLLIESADNAYTTAAYSYSQFGSGYKIHLPLILK